MVLFKTYQVLSFGFMHNELVKGSQVGAAEFASLHELHLPHRGRSGIPPSNGPLQSSALCECCFSLHLVIYFLVVKRPGGCTVFMQLKFKQGPRFSFCWKLVHILIPQEVRIWLAKCICENLSMFLCTLAHTPSFHPVGARGGRTVWMEGIF